MKILNRTQRDHLAKLSFRVVEILLAGVVVAGFMNDNLKAIIWKLVIGMAIMPFFVLIGLLLSADDDEEPP